jgi:hypothetical protein
MATDLGCVLGGFSGTFLYFKNTGNKWYSYGICVHREQTAEDNPLNGVALGT